MTREELIYEVCPYKSMIDCHSEELYTHFKCKDCSILMNNWFDEYDKHVIEQYKADTGLKDTIRDIHDNVANEMYCKGIDDFLSDICKMIVQSENNGNYRFYAVEIKQSIADLAEQLKDYK